MLRPEKYFDQSYEYVDLWASGFVKAHAPNSDGEVFTRQKQRVVEALMERFDVINKLRHAIGLEEMSVEDTYDYYVNNMPEYDEKKNVIDLYNYDLRTRELSEKEESFSRSANAQAYLLVMGAPDVFIDNSQVVQERLDHINRLLLEGGYKKISPQKTEEILEKLLVTSNW
jgi:hypothetical protein